MLGDRMPDLSPLLELADLGLTAEQYAGVLRVIQKLTETKAERERRLSAERQRRFRARKKAGK